MTGMAAIAFCAAFTSCSKNENLYDEGQVRQNEASQIVEEYNRAFIAAFGQPAADQAWGFKGYANGTRTADPRGNMWADEGWNVPPVISNAQKDIVRRYFQQNTPLGYNDPGWSDFWIQQVYKGGTKTTDGSKTTEQYKIGNGDWVTGGDHMDHLCSKSANGTEDHVNDFNNSDNNDWEGRMLMVSSSTYSFGYINSNATAIHYDKAALVSWRVIAQWAVDNGLESSVEASVLNDGWNRSYMGFDWEQALPDDCYSRNITYGQWVAPENRDPSKQYTSDGVEILSVTYNTFVFEGETYRFLSANTNQYAYDQNEPTFGGKKNYNDKPSDDIIRQLLSLGYLPYSDTFKDWIKLSTGSDGYYSDWIVTLTKAKKDPEPDPNVVRIIAEDLSISSDPTKLKGDFDFNDVVFDVTFNADKSVATIQLVAAGGVLPLTVAGVEVHQAFGQSRDMSTGWYPMINTGGIAQVNGATAASFTYNNPGENGINIPVLVNKFTKNADGTFTDNWIELEAKQGQCPAKLCVNQTFEYCEEREPIDSKYTGFQSWVQGNKYIWW